MHNIRMMYSSRYIFVALSWCVLAGSIRWGYTTAADYFDKDNPLVKGDQVDAEVKGVKVPWADANDKIKNDTLVNVIKGAINRVLGILALIALVILLWWGFQMVTANGDDGQYKMGFTLLKQAAGGLAMIGVAWFLISIIFFVITLVTDPANVWTDAWTDN